MATDHASLICRVSTRYCGLPLAHVVEIMRPLPIEPLSGVSRPVRGLSIVRGRPIPVVDLAWTFTADNPSTGRFVSIEVANRRVALAVDSVIGVRSIPADTLQELPPLLRDADAESIVAIGTLDAELLIMLHSAHLLPDAVWRELEARGAA